MSVTSPKSASPSASIVDWDEAAVQSFMVHLGLGQYEDSIYDQGITGDVLSVMDHTSLQDLGINSVGHRLNLLRSVWELKKEQGIEMGEDDWRPQDADDVVHPSQASVDRLWDLILEQHDRLMHIERDHSRLLGTLEENGIIIPPPSADAEMDVQGIPGDGVGPQETEQGLGRNGSLRWKDFRERSTDGDNAATNKVARRASALFPSSLASSTNSSVPAPSTSSSSTFQDSFTPTTASASYPFDSPLAHMNADRDRDRTQLHQQRPAQAQTQAQHIQPPPLTRLLSGSSMLGASASPPGTTPPAGSNSQQAQAQAQSQSLSSNPKLSTLDPSVSSSAPNPNPSPSPAPPAASGPTDKERSRAKDAAHSAAKSFRVTLEDPCWKVLPAALKKYKINDDWKMYALFICFDNTERCLSYDEKPLMLFQKLKETGHRPVFMLRHIKDIKSPIAVAQQKQAAKLGFPANTPMNLLPKIKPTSDTSVSPTKANTLQPSSTRDDGQTPNGGAFPELPSPGLREDGSGGPRSAINTAATANSNNNAGSAMGTLVDKDGNVTNVTYAVAIYPYIADREDEFHVAVGSTFVILSKSKGWYIVQKDPDGLGNVVPDRSQSGWVPAGCLLELSSPISIISPTQSGEIAAYPGLSTLPPSAIISSSYAGCVLMDYQAKGDDELTLKEGEKVRVYKKYCHWSYSIKSDTGERGWVPAWFVGKTGNSTSTSNGNGNGTSGSGGGGGGGGDGSLPSSATTATPTPVPTGTNGDGEEGSNQSTNSNVI